MDSKKFKLVLAMTVITVPLAFTGCGKDVEEVPVEDTQASVESTINTEVNETIEEDLADEGIGVDESTPTPTPTPEVTEEVLDTDPMYITTMLTVSEVNVFATADETAEVIGTLPENTEVSTLGILHEAQFYQVQYDDATVGYIRTVDLCDLVGEYEEPTEDVTTNVEVVEPESVTEETPAPEANNSLPSDSNLGGLTDQQLQDILIESGFGGASEGYDPYAPVPEFEMDWDSTGAIPHTVQ